MVGLPKRTVVSRTLKKFRWAHFHAIISRLTANYSYIISGALMTSVRQQLASLCRLYMNLKITKGLKRNHFKCFLIWSFYYNFKVTCMCACESK